jgi:hypothetical protein
MALPPDPGRAKAAVGQAYEDQLKQYQPKTHMHIDSYPRLVDHIKMQR